MRTLCIYAFHQYNYNVDFFIKNGLFSDTNIDFYFVINDPDFKLDVPGCTVINRNNDNFDNGGWSHVLFLKDENRFLYEKYDYFVFLNSTVRGPFLPVWRKDKNWIKSFTDQLTDELKLFGTMICFFNYNVHVQSMFFATDKIGLQIGINAKIFAQDEPSLTKFDVCMNKEIGYSTSILDAGYNIGCMLKAFDGVDFRKCRKMVNTLYFFEPYSYFGTNVHPYEVIFCKIMGDDRQSGHNKEIVDKYTNWTLAPQYIEEPTFDWIYYLTQYEDLRKASIKTEPGALKHYQFFGQKEARRVNSNSVFPNFYQIDLNPLRTSGLLNQLWSLVNGILIGHYTGKHIVINGFYPDYNQPRTVPIKDLIDIQDLNCLIVKLGLRTHVTTSIEDVTWKDSRFINPTKAYFSKHGFVDVISFLKSEDDKYINIGDTFCDNIFRRNSDIKIQKLFVKLISGLKVTRQVNDIISYIKKSINITSDYKVVHLRLEDDIIRLRPYKEMSEREYGNSVYQKYKDTFEKHLDPNDTIFISTHLLKSENMYNYVIGELKLKYPKIVMTNDWRSKFSSFHLGRDIDALIDYTICMEGSSFIGYGFSTFSQAIKFKYDEFNKPVVMIF